jgi:transposase
MIDAMSLVGTVFSGLSALVIEDVEDAGDMICVRARTRDRALPCPGCGAETARVHGHHERTAADVPVDGRRVLVTVKVRRMRCPVLDCPRQTFREQVPGVLDRYQRRTARLAGQVSATVRELAGRAGYRLLSALGIGVSRHTALRALLRIALPALEVPRVLGVDFALRRGLVYATVLIDAGTGRRVDVLQGRTADVVGDWLRGSSIPTATTCASGAPKNPGSRSSSRCGRSGSSATRAAPTCSSATSTRDAPTVTGRTWHPARQPSSCSPSRTA